MAQKNKTANKITDNIADELDGDMVIVSRKKLMELWRRYNEYKQVLRSMASEI